MMPVSFQRLAAHHPAVQLQPLRERILRLHPDQRQRLVIIQRHRIIHGIANKSPAAAQPRGYTSPAENRSGPKSGAESHTTAASEPTTSSNPLLDSNPMNTSNPLTSGQRSLRTPRPA